MQIKESSIDFWKIKKTLQFKIERKMYPPRVRMTIDAPDIEPRIKLPLRFEGCLDSQLDMEIHFPLSIKIYGISLFVFILHTFTITDCYFKNY